MAKILIGGDLYPGPESVSRLCAGRIAEVFDGLLTVFAESDFVLANLEGPLITEPTPIEKVGPHHGFNEDCIIGLAKAGFRALNLGNNHLMDHGEPGLLNTVRCLDRQDIAHVGAGKDLQAAGQPLICNVRGLRLGILSFTEFEFGMAGSNRCGTHPIDPVHFVRTVERHRQSWDRFVVLLHAGNEYHPYPRPQLRELARFMCEQGAAAVVFQHSHCAGCWEEHAGGYIIHGQGNLLFDTRGAHACELNGFLVALQLDASMRPQLELVPYVQQSSGLGPQLLEGKEKELFLAGLAERSAAIQQPGFVEQQWDRFTTESPYNYLALVHGYRRRIRELDRKFGFLRHCYSRDRMRMLLHLMRCESHREAIITALTNALKR